MKPERYAPWLALPLLALIAAVVWFYRPAPVDAQRIACANPAAGCEARLARGPVRVGMEGEIKVLSPFSVWAHAPGAREVRASFSMEGMDMGFNLYTLRPDADGVFRARVTLPVCVTGRRDWEMTLSIDGETLIVPFVTEL